MKIHRFILPFNSEDSVIEITDKQMVNQMQNVLKLKKGEPVILCLPAQAGDGKMNEVVGEIAEIDREVVKVKVIKVQKNENELAVDVTLYCAVLKKENFELVVQKATEVGVKEIVPVITRRTVKLNVKQERLEKIIKEATEQSGRGMVLVMREPMEFAVALEDAKKNEVNFFYDASGAPPAGGAQTVKKIGIFIGPEGGFDESEISQAKNAGFIIKSLGKLILRAETAAIITAYLATRWH